MSISVKFLNSQYWHNTITIMTGKGKETLCLSKPWRNARGTEVRVDSLLSSALDGGGQIHTLFASTPPPTRNKTGTYWTGGWVARTVYLYVLEKRRISRLCRNSSPVSQTGTSNNNSSLHAVVTNVELGQLDWEKRSMGAYENIILIRIFKPKLSVKAGDFAYWRAL